MSKKMMAAGLVVVVGSLVFAGLAFAQTPAPATPGQGYGRGQGMMGGGAGRGGMMGGWAQSQGEAGAYGGMLGGYGRGRGGMMGGNFDAANAGPLHTYMLDAFAQALDITRADLDAQLAAGQTMVDIATANGLTQAEFFEVMQTARTAALAQAVADGVLTQAQADQMQGRMFQNGGPGTCPHFNSAPAVPTTVPTNS
ncbi:MAG: hypothetical protein KA764_20165 [Anaerolineales bacterium]|nr:hypothetical protein [Anaerolineales bacterium]